MSTNVACPVRTRELAIALCVSPVQRSRSFVPPVAHTAALQRVRSQGQCLSAHLHLYLCVRCGAMLHFEVDQAYMLKYTSVLYALLGAFARLANAGGVDVYVARALPECCGVNHD